MRIRAAIVDAIIITAVAACGSFGESSPDGDPSAPDAAAGGLDGGPNGADAASVPDAAPILDAAVPRPPPSCPMGACPSGLGSQCEDDACDPEAGDGIDFKVTGAVQSPEGRCQASSPTGQAAFTSENIARTSPRDHVALAFHLAHSNVTTERAIASFAVQGDPSGERFEAVIKEGKLLLCERSDGHPSTCTAGVPIADKQDVQLYGVMSSETPPRAAFALSVACGPPQILSVTRPFGMANVVGSVGCLNAAPMAETCALEFDDVVLLVTAE